MWYSIYVQEEGSRAARSRTISVQDYGRAYDTARSFLGQLGRKVTIVARDFRRDGTVMVKVLGSWKTQGEMPNRESRPLKLF